MEVGLEVKLNNSDPEEPASEVSDPPDDLVPFSNTDDNDRDEVGEFFGDLMDGVLDSCMKVIRNKALKDSSCSVIKRKKLYSCVKCEKAYSQYVSLEKHVKLCGVMKPKKAGIKCPLCEKTILFQRNLKRHMDEMHVKPRKNQDRAQKAIPTCNECEKQFSSKHKLKEHIGKKHGGNGVGGDLLHCKECTFSNISRSQLRAHCTLKHSGVKLFDCELCPGLSYHSKRGLYKHKRTVHKKEIQSDKETVGNSIVTVVFAKKSLPPGITKGDPLNTNVPPPETLPRDLLTLSSEISMSDLSLEDMEDFLAIGDNLNHQRQHPRACDRC